SPERAPPWWCDGAIMPWMRSKWMRAATAAVVAGAACAGAPWDPSGSAEAQCKRACAPGETRDGQGCCTRAPPQAPTARPDAGGAAPPCPADMAELPGGTYTLADRGDTVTVAPFCLDKTEVTAEAYEACVTSGACTAEHLREGSPDGR